MTIIVDKDERGDFATTEAYSSFKDKDFDELVKDYRRMICKSDRFCKAIIRTNSRPEYSEIVYGPYWKIQERTQEIEKERSVATSFSLIGIALPDARKIWSMK
jgi:hypothetical protein